MTNIYASFISIFLIDQEVCIVTNNDFYLFFCFWSIARTDEYTYTYIHTYIHIYIFIHNHIYIYIYIYMHLHTYIYIYINIYILIEIKVYIKRDLYYNGKADIITNTRGQFLEVSGGVNNH